jgi:hypothetical protein
MNACTLVFCRICNLLSNHLIFSGCVNCLVYLWGAIFANAPAHYVGSKLIMSQWWRCLICGCIHVSFSTSRIHTVFWGCSTWEPSRHLQLPAPEKSVGISIAVIVFVILLVGEHPSDWWFQLRILLLFSVKDRMWMPSNKWQNPCIWFREN